MPEKKPKKITLKSLDGRIAGMDQRMVGMDKRMIQMDERITGVDERVTQMDKRVTEMDKKISEMDGKMIEMGERIVKVELVMERMDTKFDLMLEGFSAINKRMDGLETAIKEGFAEVDYKFGIVFEKFDEIDAALMRKANIA